MIDSPANRILHLALENQSSLKTVDLYPRLRSSQLFTGPPESLEPERYCCCPIDQSFICIIYILIWNNYLAICGIQNNEEEGLKTDTLTDFLLLYMPLTESLEPDRFSCCPRDQLFFLY